MPKDQNQHYIPQFYQRQWAGPDGRLCEYCRRHRSVQARLCHPAGSGYQPALYTIPDVPPTVANHTENVFLAETDTGAAEALRMLLSPEPYVWTSGTRSAWTRFLMSLMHRTPERVAFLKARVQQEYPKLLAEFRANYPTLRRPGDPETFDEYEARMAPNPSGRASAVLLQKLIDSTSVGTRLNQMRWHVVTFSNMREPLLTSDRPIIMTNGIDKHLPNAHIALPVSPYHLFVAVNDDEVLGAIQAMGPAEVLHNANDKVVLQAKKYVYGRDASQLAFVEPRLGQQLRPSKLRCFTAAGSAPCAIAARAWDNGSLPDFVQL